MSDNQSLADAFLRLVAIMDELREQCPWDRKQTIQTLRTLTIEELYELADAISEENWNGIREELGDLFLHILFYSRIGKEQQQFTLQEVIEGISQKLIARHPHIYSEVVVKDEEEVKQNWEKLKLKEGKTSVLSGVPAALPAVVKATRLQEKAKQVGFEWETKEQVLEKVMEEMKELQAAIQKEDKAEMENELGDVFFSLVNYARFLQLDAESALDKTNKKFIRRFTEMELKAIAGGKQLADMSLEEMDAIWDAIKKQTQGH
ncbi:MAG TPA: nucleoside triphosphate pyrophosphohydrolase [Chitinophagaceae bacterium]|nr:nucleoside triphosphate pyrophosphohydrolase [Chitinophagaceae bacterium]